MPLPLAFSAADEPFQTMQLAPRVAPQSLVRKQWVVATVVSFLQLKFHQPQPHFQQSGSLFGSAFAAALGFAIGAAEPWWLSRQYSA